MQGQGPLVAVFNKRHGVFDYRDYLPQRQWSKYRECRVGADFLRIYRIVMVDKPWGAAVFARAGTHSGCF